MFGKSGYYTDKSFLMSMRVLLVMPGDGSPTCMPFAHRFEVSLSKAGIEVRNFWLLSRTSPKDIFNEALRFRQIIRNFKPDIVHAYYGTVTSFFCLMNSSKPLIITFHGSDLNPVPFLAEDFRYLRAAFIPILIDGSLNEFEIGSCDSSFSDSNRQHDHCITEKKFGRQEKVKKSEKNIGRENLTGKWVETKNRGLKIGKILGGSNY